MASSAQQPKGGGGKAAIGMAEGVNGVQSRAFTKNTQHLMFRSAREEGEMTGPDSDLTVAPKSCLG